MDRFYVDAAGSRYHIGFPFSYGEMNYTSTGATAEMFAALGFKEVPVQPRPDDTYYEVSPTPNDDGSWDVKEQDLDALKQRFLSENDSICGDLLAPTDWVVVRLSETGQAVPDSTAVYRMKVRQVHQQREAGITKASSLGELQAAMEALEPWPS